MVDGASHPRQTSVRPSIRRLVYWLGPVLLLIGSWQIWDAIEASRLARAISRVFPGGMPDSPAVVFAAGPRRPAGGSDAAPYYAAANIAAVTIGFGGESRRPSRFEVVTAYRESLLQGAEVPPEAVAAASAYLVPYGLPLRLMEEARHLPHGGSTPGAESAYRVSGLSTIGSLAGLRTLELIRTGQTEAAVDSLIARMQFVRAFDSPRLWDARLRTQQVQMLATDTGILLSRASLSGLQMAPLQDAFRAVREGVDLADVIAAEVSRLYGNLQSIWSGRRVGTGAFVWLARPALRHHTTALVQITADALAASRLPWPDRAAAMAAIDERRSIVPEVVPFVAAWRILQQFQDDTAVMAAGVASVRSGRLAVALEQYRRQFGALPSQLGDLAPGMEEEEVQDPFTGEPLRYTHNEEGYLVYSVGADGRDDGGRLTADLPRGRMPGTVPPPDIGVRVSYPR